MQPTVVLLLLITSNNLLLCDYYHYIISNCMLLLCTFVKQYSPVKALGSGCSLTSGNATLCLCAGLGGNKVFCKVAILLQ